MKQLCMPFLAKAMAAHFPMPLLAPVTMKERLYTPKESNKVILNPRTVNMLAHVETSTSKSLWLKFLAAFSYPPLCSVYF